MQPAMAVALVRNIVTNVIRMVRPVVPEPLSGPEIVQ